jgi:hypothetical protein
MKRNGELIVDCCQCSSNWLTDKKRRRKLDGDCCDRYACELLRALTELDSTLQIMNAFPGRHKGIGNEMLTRLGFEKPRYSDWWRKGGV